MQKGRDWEGVKTVEKPHRQPFWLSAVSCQLSDSQLSALSFWCKGLEFASIELERVVLLKADS
jgi:hypothetical protein